LTSDLPDVVQVLHIDDDPSFAEVTKEFLERADDRIRVTTVSDPTDAVDRVESEKPHCIVSDYDMPRMDGLELYGELTERGIDLPFILFTGKGSESIAADAMSAEVTDYIQKGGTDTYEVVANRVLDAVRSRQRKRVAQKAINHYSALVENAHLPVYHYDDDGTIRYVNEAATDLFGADSPDDLIGESVFDYHPSEHDSKVESRLSRLEAGDRIPPAKLRFHSDDRARIAKVSCVATPHDDDAVGQTIAHDVTDLRRSERDLRLFREIVTKALDRGEAAIWSYDLDSEEISHYGVASLLGVDDADLTDDLDSFLQYVHPDDRNAVRSAYTTALEEGEPYSLRFRVETADGDSRYLEDRGGVITEEGPATHVLGMVVDVTDYERHKQQLEEQREQVEEIATILSHDLQGPLRTLEGRLELLREADSRTEHIQQAEAMASRLEEMIDGVVRTIRAGKPVTDVEEIRLSDVATDAARTSSIQSDDLSVATDGTVEADPDSLRRLFQNLLDNAAEHGGTTVTVEVGVTDGGFYVADDGSGLPEDRRNSLFDFGVTTADDGTGIGLASVERIVQSHGWEIEAMDGEEGARFEVSGVDVRPERRDTETVTR
jgi:PAS domain S-box-containing protein